MAIYPKPQKEQFTAVCTYYDKINQVSSNLMHFDTLDKTLEACDKLVNENPKTVVSIVIYGHPEQNKIVYFI